jgi:hypothetical protein
MKIDGYQGANYGARSVNRRRSCVARVGWVEHSNDTRRISESVILPLGAFFFCSLRASHYGTGPVGF